ncbi:glycerophosphodiester phosphodiesterase domain-containing protein 5-like isoform X3 [Ranitomeya imitator]|uniref:glycerophosphodiester phosphodiesterase domain-containing protein 5-like isoform X3 n=1 Tax=Ranitomeya imitator TaxID=111125 RepID=UPI0037E74E71
MVKHQPLQYYEPQLCLSCLTGIYGCRWKRYQRSHDDTTKWELLWFMILTFTFFLTLTWFYFWWEVHNDYNEFNWFLYNRTGRWSDWSIPILVSTAAAFTYITVLLILALCHIAVGQQLNLHWLHKGFLAVVLIATVVAMASVEQMWDEEWDVLLISFQATAPFLHIGALVAITLLSWIIAGQFARSEKAIFQICLILAYLAVVIALYLVPMTISSPCIMEKDLLGPKPSIIGHRGAPMLAPENTLMSFKKALELGARGLQADVTVSSDGISFIMHDDTLRRTTNVNQVFPELSAHLSAMFNWTDLERLNAGDWFIKTDPFWTVGSLSLVEVTEAANQSVCKLTDLLDVVKESNASVLLRIHQLPSNHPHYDNYINITVHSILQSGLPQEQVIWALDDERSFVRHLAPNFKQASNVKREPKFLKDRGITFANLRYTEVNQEDIRWRLGSIRTYNPEQIMLSAAVRRSSRDVRIMKEKLIFSEINNSIDTPEELSLCSENRYEGFSNNAITPTTDSKTKSSRRIEET